MATKQLTQRLVDGLKYAPGCDYIEWDAKVKGLGVRVTERTTRAGTVERRKMYIVGYRPKDSRQFRRYTLGSAAEMTLEKARDAATRARQEAKDGKDPLEAKRAARAEATVRELGDAFLADVRVRRKVRTAVGYARFWNRLVLPALGAKKVAKVTSAEVRRLHRSLHETPHQANRVVALVGAFFAFAAGEGARAAHDNPARGIELYEEEGRERYLTPAEFKSIGEALAKAEREGLPPAPKHRRKPKDPKKAKHRPKSADKPIPANPFGVAAIRLLALTGCRVNEVLSLRWDAVDSERGYLRLAETKTGRSVRPLGDAAAEVLRELPRVEGSPYVFPAMAVRGDRSDRNEAEAPTTDTNEKKDLERKRQRPKHLSEVKRLWYAVRHAAGLDDVRLHDLRHSFASVPAQSKESPLILRDLLGHARVATTERYAHLGDDLVKRAADRTSGDIAAWLDGKDTKVTPIRAKA